ncbi:MAG: DUF4058 family protein, partial [Armatimonadetes bacterium]|nr:DUF4058 family protein [Armatimonadota bacterium]
AEALSAIVPKRYRIRIEERATVIALGGEPKRVFEPDILVVGRKETQTETQRQIASVATADEEQQPDPAIIIEALIDEEFGESFIAIVDRTGQKLVTVIELLSPTNKRQGEWRRQYLEKQQIYLESRVNLVEIDLLRQGEHAVAAPKFVLEKFKPFYGIISVWRAAIPYRFEVYPVKIHERLPRIAVPLLPEDKDVVLDIQRVFDRCYDAADYALDIDYTQPPPVPLTDEEQAWLENWLKEKGLREKRNE